MDNTQLFNDYHFNPSRLLARILLGFYGFTLVLIGVCLWDIMLLRLPLAVWLTPALTLDALRLCRRHAWQTTAHAIVRISYSPNERLCYLHAKSGSWIRASADSVLVCLPGVVKIEWLLLGSQKRVTLFIAKDQLPNQTYHPFRLRMESQCKMSKC